LVPAIRSTINLNTLVPPNLSHTIFKPLTSADQIIQRFDATISAVFYGHTHHDEFEIAYSTPAAPTAETAVMVSYIAPALTPTSGNPTFRVYSVDPVTFAILDYTVYYTDMSSPTYQSGPVWEKLYSVKEAYGSLLTPPYTDPTAELTPAFWHNVTVLFENDDAVFQTWYARRGRDYSTATCTGTCKTAFLCELRASQSQYNWYFPFPSSPTIANIGQWYRVPRH
jgi:sphingomyelin phosphodiesterase